MTSSGYPVPARPERIADGAVHGLGVVLAALGAALLVAHAPGGRAVPVAVYAGALLLTFLASAAYHMAPWDRLRPWLRRIDHAAIFLKIAGTVTPLAVLAGGALAHAVLLLVWVAALGGAAAKIAFWRAPGRWSHVPYLVLGWVALPLLWPLASALPLAASLLVAAGGLLYTAGTVFYARESLRFSTAIWHGFVLAASACFFAAIAVGTLAP